MSTDQRKYPRIKTVLDIEYSKKHSTAMALEEELFYSYGEVTDLSRVGACLLADEPLEPNLGLQVKGIGQHNGPIDCVVKWSHKNHGRKYRIGIEFTQLVEI